MHIKIDMIGDISELTALLHELRINPIFEEDKPVKTENTKNMKKRGRPRKTQEPVQTDDQEKEELRERIFGGA